jgi:hypothetical protein
MNKNIWQDQLEFNKKFFEDMGLDLSSLSLEQKIHWCKEFFFHVNKEMSDLVNCLPHWKMHYKNDEEEIEIVTSNLIEEYVDVFKYLMGLGQLLGISYNDLLKGYKDKTEVVLQKYEQNKKFQSLLDKPVIIFDIDGVINNYPDCFLDWLRKKKKLNYKTLEQLKAELDLKTYENLKTEYRVSREKRKQPINIETVKVMQSLKEKGEKIVLFTNRPVSKYKVINTDTLYWLNSNKIPFDAIYWSDYQRKEDIYKLKFKIKFIVEDNLDNAKNFNHEGHLVFLLQKTHNQDEFYKNKLLIRIDSPLEILKHDMQKTKRLSRKS